MPLVLDTGPLLAALDAADRDHARCAELLLGTSDDLIVPTLVLSELDYWCQKRLGPEAWLGFLDDVLDGAYRVEHPISADLSRCRELQSRYDDLGLGVVDSSVLALVERLGLDSVATLDHRHFGVVKLRHCDSIRLLP